MSAPRAALLCMAAALALACGDAPVAPPPPGDSPSGDQDDLAPTGGPIPLAVPTYDGSGQATHPDVVYIPGGWHGWEYWMALTPFPGSDARMENPSLLVSHDGRTWSVPAGLVNPVVAGPPLSPPDENGNVPDVWYNSDPDLVFDEPRDRLVMTYREVRGGQNVIETLASRDGVTWTAPEVAFAEPNHRAISPAVVLPLVGGVERPRVWYVDAGAEGCRASRTSVKLRYARAEPDAGSARLGADWSEPVTVGLVQPGYAVWHLDVAYVPDKREYWAIYAAYVAGRSCSRNDLFFARSANGLTWTTYRDPFLRTGVRTWAATSLYRSSFRYDPATDVLTIWLSARGNDGTWHIGRVRYHYARFLQSLVPQ